MKMTYWYNDRIARRYRLQSALKYVGCTAVFSILLFIVFLLATVAYRAIPAFESSYMAIDLPMEKSVSSRTLIYNSLYKRLRPSTPRQRRMARSLVSSQAPYVIDAYVKKYPGFAHDMARVWVPTSDVVDQYLKGNISLLTPEKHRQLSNKQIFWIDALKAQNRISRRFNVGFFKHADSRDPTQAGIFGAILGSVMTLGICFFLTFFVGVFAAIYLEEFAKKNRISYLIETTINNLAAVPSIVFGLLGLAVLLNVFGMPRSAPVTGGTVLAMMSLPTIIIVTRAALRAVPNSLRDAGLSLGCTKLQMVLHHVLPKAASSIVTGTIISMVQALGETAPLLMIGMVAFIADAPANITDPAVTLPVQIYLWSTLPEMGFAEKASAAILILLFIVFTLTGVAGYIRYKIEKK